MEGNLEKFWTKEKKQKICCQYRYSFGTHLLQQSRKYFIRTYIISYFKYKNLTDIFKFDGRQANVEKPSVYCKGNFSSKKKQKQKGKKKKIKEEKKNWGEIFFE